ncbi:uncharacterized protein M437DRAFT_39638 [Aureobasidium melanogenum CBS 110374]|uniref:Uncharacterized protein n=1 Tax=Aureobasidium melanogenum (strain CBS 110374) TaxID=1043003 RepID=A0A074W9M0_AURM1|nr:uncharacterized protein M437DRAFT_39638 [Aureobasidium melanogenum CBS 110374]KEQ66597.1 hypothetical protein M437DRAFT_39638 [Aureobasidium melanogenum CBS 110374]
MRDAPSEYESLLSFLRGHCDHPEVVFRKLFFGPIEDLTLPKPLPAPQAFQEDADLIWTRYDAITLLRGIQSFVSQDNPTNSIYRMCEFICADQPNQLMLEVKYFSNQTTWRLEEVSDPLDDNSERRAIFACIVESLVVAFNYKASLGVMRKGVVMTQSRCPTWVSEVGALDRLLILTQVDEWVFAGSDDPFSRRNIRANAGNIFSF